jgi:hypothetical protein
MGWGPMFLRYFGDLVHADYGSYSLIRLAGVGFFLAGALLLAVRTVVDLEHQRRIGFAMVAAHVAGGLIVWSQQKAIWGSPLGAALTGWLWLAAASFAVVLIRESRQGQASFTRRAE